MTTETTALSPEEFDELDAILDDLRTRGEDVPQWEFCEGVMAALLCTRRPVPVDEYLQTTYPNILACGDVAGPYQFTHVAAHQAWYAAVNGLFGMLRRFKADYRVIPWCTFVDPEVARVGLNVQEARERGIAFEITRYGIDDLDRAIADSAAHGWVQVLTEPGRDRILGVIQSKSPPFTADPGSLELALAKSSNFSPALIFAINALASASFCPCF